MSVWTWPEHQRLSRSELDTVCGFTGSFMTLGLHFLNCVTLEIQSPKLALRAPLKIRDQPSFTGMVRLHVKLVMCATVTIWIQLMAPSVFLQEYPFVLGAAQSTSDIMHFVEMSFFIYLFTVLSVFWYVLPNVMKHYNLNFFVFLLLWK